MARLYGVGVGPGDSELITLKALRVLESADVIAVPVTGSGSRTAYDIAKGYIRDKKILECTMPMTRDEKKLADAYKKAADDIFDCIRAGMDVAYITLGDPCVYSSFTRIRSALVQRCCAVETVPAVTSFCAAAARLEMPLCDGSEPLVIIPADCENTGSLLDIQGTKVIMKSGGRLGEVKALLTDKGLDGGAVMVEKCGMDGEKIYTDIEKTDSDKSYFSVIIVR